MTDQRTQNLPPIWQKPLDSAIHLRVYRNGDDKFPGKVVTLNKFRQKTFESWLGDLSSSMKLRSGAVWRVFTPVNGHRVDSLEPLEDGQLLVVGGQEKFKKMRYAQIDPNPKKGPPPKYDAEPGHNRLYQVSGRYRKIDAHGKIIKCWPNGNDSMGPRTVLLSYRQPFTLDSILDQVSGVLKDEICGPVEKLYLPNGIKVMSLDQILPNAHYVALRRQDHFKRAHYREVSLPNFRTSPRLERKSILAPLSRSTKTSSHSSPEHSYASNNGSENSYTQSYRRDKARKEEDQVFHARPVKHKRSSEKTRQVDYDEDQGGVFKAKNANHATKGARPIDDSRQTRTEVPVDKRPAREVEEEDDFSPRYTTQDRRGGGDHHEEETKGKDDKNKNKKEPETTYRANTKRPTPPGGDQANKEAEKEARARREAEDRERAEKARQQREAMNNKKKDDAEKKKREEDEKKRQEDEDRNNKNKGDAEKKKREEEEKRRQQYEAKNSKNKDDAEKKKREEEEKRRQQDEAKNIKNKDDAEKKKREEEEKKRQQDQAKNNKNKDDAEKKKREEEGKRKQQEEQERKKREEEEAKKKKQQQQQPAKGKKTSTPETNKNKARDGNKNNHRSTPTPQASPINHQQDEEELAAARIQAGYRGYKTRKDLKEQQVVGKVDQKGRQAQQMERDADDELEEYHRQLEREEEQAAAKIQAGYRGFKTRQELKAKKADERVYRQDSNYMRDDPIPLHDDDDQWGPGPADDHEEDREHKAAATIQAGFRGYKDRQKVKDMRTQQG